MALWIEDSGTWKEPTPWINDAGTWKEPGSVWINDGGTWKEVFTSSTILDSFESFSSGAPDGWTVTQGSSSNVVANTSFVTDGSQSVELDGVAEATAVAIEKSFALSNYENLSIDVKLTNAESSGVSAEINAIDDSENTIVSSDSISGSAGDTAVLTVDVSGLDDGDIIQLKTNTNETPTGSNEVSAAFDALRYGTS